MGTLVRITIYSENAGPMRAAFRRIAELDETLSDYKPDSELNKLCRTVSNPVKVSEDLFRLLEASEKLSRLTDGAFDITIGPVTHLWRLGKTPDVETMTRVGWRNLVLDKRHRTAELKLAGMQLDLGAIAKGYAADEALKTLRRLGVQRALIALSGDIVAGDAPPGTKGWRVGLEPAGGEILLRNAAVSTSGDTEQFRDIGGVRYSHIIDPKTGLGLTSAIAVTVVARRGLEADPIATAVSVMGEERGRKVFERRVRKLIVVAPR
ncbi:MAG TPA: FAD:protein FMN transferase [Bryobacteraceae bacterium]|jgi:thiamine biosynthesis lipoprotein|nr:FAD:protein FMN transferase [Bryobacteraceae bacterium]